MGLSRTDSTNLARSIHFPLPIERGLHETGGALRSAVSHAVSALGLRETITWRRVRHRVALLTEDRINSHFTGFFRLPTQFDLLAGPIIASFAERTRGSALTIAVLGCSNGAEAYSIASVLRRSHPDLEFDVRGYDISQDCVSKATSARYEADEVFNNRILSYQFVCSTFDRIDDSFVVKDDIARRVSFEVGNVLSTDLQRTVGPCDIVFAQNVLFHMRLPVARQALLNIATLVRRGSAVFIDGVDLDLRQRFTRRMGWIPLTYEMERIHDEARRARAAGWPYHYWGLEPFLGGRQAARRYATAFMVP